MTAPLSVCCMDSCRSSSLAGSRVTSVSKMFTTPEPSNLKSTAWILFIRWERSFRWLNIDAEPPTMGSLKTISSSASGSSMSRSSETPGNRSKKGLRMASMSSPSISGSLISCGSKCSGSPGSAASTDSKSCQFDEATVASSCTVGACATRARAGSTLLGSRCPLGRVSFT